MKWEMGSGDAERVFFLEDNIVLKNGTMCVAHSLTKSEIAWELDFRNEPIVLSDAGGRRLVVGSKNGFVHVVSGRTGRILASANVGIRPRAASTDGQSVVLLTERGDLRFWRPDKSKGFVGDSIDRIRTDVVMDATGKRIVVLRQDGSLELWRVEDGEMTGVAGNVSFSGGVNRVVFDKSGDFLAAISRDGRVHVLESDSGEPVGEFVFHSRRVTDVSALPDGSGLVTANEDGLVYRFSTKRRTAGPKVDRSVEAGLLYADFSPPGNSINMVDVDMRCHVWRYPTGTAFFPPFRFPDGQLALDSGDTSEILFHKDGEIFLMIVHKWFERSPQTVIEGGVASGRISRDLKRALIGTNDGAASLVSIWDSKEVHRWREFGEKVNVTAMTQDGKIGAIASGGSICMLSLVPPFEILSRCEHGGEIRWLDIDADGQVLASGSTDNSACLWDLSTGKRIGPKLKHAEYAGGGEYPARGVFGVFSLGGKRLVTTGSPDRTARVWDTETGEAAIDPLPHDSLVTCVDISSDERWVATGTESGEASLWDVATGEKIAPSWRREVPVLSVALHPEDNVLLIAWKDGLCRTLALVPSDLQCEDWFLDFADSLAGRRFNERDVLESVTAAEVLGWQDRISEVGKSDVLKKFAFWLVSPDRERHPFPF
jgi:WD40 repeat protein